MVEGDVMKGSWVWKVFSEMADMAGIQMPCEGMISNKTEKGDGV